MLIIIAPVHNCIRDNAWFLKFKLCIFAQNLIMKINVSVHYILYIHIYSAILFISVTSLSGYTYI